MAIQQFDFYVNNTPAPAPHGLVRFIWDDATGVISTVHVEVGGLNGDGTPAQMFVHVIDPAANPPVDVTQNFIANTDGSLSITDFTNLPKRLTKFFTLTTTQKGTIGFTDSSVEIEITMSA